MSDRQPLELRPVRLWHGGDYNPDQWPADVRRDDVRLMKLAGVNIASVAIFAWSQIEPKEGRYDWSWLDETFDRLHEAGVSIALATPSAAHPRWLTARHPEVMAVDDHGVRRRHGVRQRFCPSSPVFRRHVERINRAMAERYGNHPALVLWHVSNEYTGPRCYCDLCAEGFRRWLADRYGDLAALNEQWWASFWSQAYSDWSQVEPPFANGSRGWQGLELDWKRFQSHLMCDFFRFEVATLRRITPNVPVTTNLMGSYGGLDYAEFADAMDVISWDSYPPVGGDPANVAFTHALMRGQKGNRPWLLMEQTPSSTNWKEFATLMPPGLMALWSWQAIGHGSDSAMYFQWRRSRGAVEKFHGAVVEHAAGTDARVFREVAALGADLDKTGPRVAGTRVAEARVGVLWDQQCRWALEGSAGPGREKAYVQTVQRHFRAIWRRNVPVDVVRMDADWSQYGLLVAPMLYMVKSGRFPLDGSPGELRRRIDEAAKLDAFVAAGGTLAATYLSGIVNESDLVYEGGYPGPLRKLMGVWIEEIDNRPPADPPNRLVLEKGHLQGLREAYDCHRYFDQLVPEGAEVLARYGADWYAGRPCLTRNQFGRGRAYYLATDGCDAFLEDYYAALTAEAGIRPLLPPADDVEALERGGQGRRLLFLLNHAGGQRRIDLGDLYGRDLLTGMEVSGQVDLEPYGVRIVEC